MNLSSRVAREAHLAESDSELARPIAAVRIGFTGDGAAIERMRPITGDGAAMERMRPIALLRMTAKWAENMTTSDAQTA